MLEKRLYLCSPDQTSPVSIVVRSRMWVWGYCRSPSVLRIPCAGEGRAAPPWKEGRPPQSFTQALKLDVYRTLHGKTVARSQRYRSWERRQWKAERRFLNTDSGQFFLITADFRGLKSCPHLQKCHHVMLLSFLTWLTCCSGPALTGILSLSSISLPLMPLWSESFLNFSVYSKVNEMMPNVQVFCRVYFTLQHAV